MKEHIWNDVLNKKSVIYYVENNKSKENTSQKMRRCVQTFDWYCTHTALSPSHTHTHAHTHTHSPVSSAISLQCFCVTSCSFGTRRLWLFIHIYVNFISLVW